MAEVKKKSTSSKKTTTKKNTVTKKISSTKKVASNTNTSKKKNVEKVDKKTLKDFFTSEVFLSIIFVLLLILVIVLGVLAYQKNEEYQKHPNSNINIPITKLETNFDFNISAFSLSNSKEYVFRVSNYDEDIKAEGEIPYKVTIENAADCVITVTKNTDSDNLMKKQKKTVIEDTLKEKDEDVYYHVKIKSSNSINNTDLIHILIES